MVKDSPQHQALMGAFQLLKNTPEGEILLQYLQGLFLYPNPALEDTLGVKSLTNDERLGHHQVICHILAMMDQ